ncbi:hypothetical protein M2323_004603 [Rhodoblastus acidophilus]|uniref:hypothetical protein n=1 Tax=Rhodoblastus acidophilus TaxID=1074 RepID=UPI00161A0617|nr:hypothetical protein [Rhodoblastus acidophilus]MCW2286798.1 hypothetical protein [Rhodoblastus acidophilus]MCW2335651.1 hypothetical protein [Rhodoblastus acidophilus]
MDETARISVQLAQIELAYAELELMHLAALTPELRRTLEHIASAKRHLCETTDGYGWAETRRAATDGADLGAHSAEP